MPGFGGLAGYDVGAAVDGLGFGGVAFAGCEVPDWKGGGKEGFFAAEVALEDAVGRGFETG